MEERWRIADVVAGWVSELDACDGFVVLLGDPADGSPLHALGPYGGLEALSVADRYRDVDGVRVVRLHGRR